MKRSVEVRVVVIILLLLIVESFIAKSFIFTDNDPIIAHYLISGVLIFLLLIFVVRRPYLLSMTTRITGSRIFLLVLIWLFLVTVTRPTILEFFALLALVLLVLCFYFTLPLICDHFDLPIRHLLLQFMVVCVLVSAAMLMLYPVESHEPPSLRFRGVFISVAVACSTFFYACIYLTWAAKHYTGHVRRLYAVLAVLAYILLLLTFTKSAILQATLGMLLLLLTNLTGHFVLKRFILILIVSLCVLIILSITVVPSVDMDDMLEKFRIIDGNFLSSREGVWEQGLNRMMDNLILGTGLMSKYSMGGMAEVEISPGAYNHLYDAHSLGISLTEQGGLPFMLALVLMMVLPLVRFVHQFGWRQALQVPEFIIMSITLPSMMFAGGDMISLGSLANRLQWLFLGILALNILYERTVSKRCALLS